MGRSANALEMDKTAGQDALDRRQTARIPTGTKLLLRAVGMRDYVLCEVLNVTTSGIELLLEWPLDTGTVVTILVRPEGMARKYYRVVGSVERREPRSARWLHVVRASSRRPWSSMFIYDVVYQALTGPKTWPANEWTYVDHDAAPRARSEDAHQTMLAAVEQASSAGDNTPDPDDDEGDYDPVVLRALAWFAPFDKLNDLARQFIARKQQVTEHDAGTTLVERGSLADISIYLVEGTVEVEPYDGQIFTITGGTRDAHFPISVLRPHAYTVKAATDVAVILLSQEMVRTVSRITAAYRNQLGIEVHEDHPPPPEAAAR